MRLLVTTSRGLRALMEDPRVREEIEREAEARRRALAQAAPEG